MARKTAFSPIDLAGILSTYNLGTLLGAEPLPGGTVQTNYRLETTRGKFVFRYYQVRSLEQVQFERDLLLYLEGAGFPCPTLVPNLAGEFLGSYQGRPYAVFEFSAGEHSSDPTAAESRSLIEKAAELHLLSPGFSSPFARQRWNYSPGLCQELAREQAAQLGTRQAADKLAWLEAKLLELDLPASLPRGICHGDFHFSNVLYQDGAFQALLDFDDANISYLVFDLVGLIEYRAWPHSRALLDLEAAREVVEIYSGVRPLAEIEQRHLFDVYLLSILFDCVWFFSRWEGESFRERKKIAALQGLGRKQFCERIFGRESWG